MLDLLDGGRAEDSGRRQLPRCALRIHRGIHTRRRRDLLPNPRRAYGRRPMALVSGHRRCEDRSCRRTRRRGQRAPAARSLCRNRPARAVHVPSLWLCGGSEGSPQEVVWCPRSTSLVPTHCVVPRVDLWRVRPSVAGAARQGLSSEILSPEASCRFPRHGPNGLRLTVRREPQIASRAAFFQACPKWSTAWW